VAAYFLFKISLFKNFATHIHRIPPNLMFPNYLTIPYLALPGET